MSENKKPLISRADKVAQTDQAKTGSYQSYILHYRQDQATLSGEWPGHHFILQEVSEQTDQRIFDSFEQVMNFLLDELQVGQR